MTSAHCFATGARLLLKVSLVFYLFRNGGFRLLRPVNLRRTNKEHITITLMYTFSFFLLCIY